ncbi:hypothetical protein QOM21_21640 [Streptomyces sp. Pv4-95]|uniref:hypothetical protein n=1 Tax=Streptomyces sp. Pv4-95 TaxID=3049543 RepID=UPI003891FC5D
MSVTGQQILKTLSLFDPIEWIRTSSGRNPVEGYTQSPHVAWRFADGGDVEIARLIETLVRNSPTENDWTLDYSARNWLLAPSRVLNECSSDNISFRQAVMRITLSDPDFCELANSDLALIISRLQDYVMNTEGREDQTR